jgi:hypothetical protein
MMSPVLGVEMVSDSDYLTEALRISYLLLSLLAPIALPATAFALATRLGFWWRTIAMILASLVSLPLSFLLMMLSNYPALFTYSHINPAMGLSAVPALVEWAVIFSGIVIVSALSVARKVKNRDRTTN